MNLRPQGCAAVRDCMDFLEARGRTGTEIPPAPKALSCSDGSHGGTEVADLFIVRRRRHRCARLSLSFP